MKKLVVDKKKCQGCGICSAIAPKTFRLVNDKSIVLKGGGDSKKSISDAILYCPEKAISYQD